MAADYRLLSKALTVSEIQQPCCPGCALQDSLLVILVNSYFVLLLEDLSFHPVQLLFSIHTNNYNKDLIIISQPNELFSMEWLWRDEESVFLKGAASYVQTTLQ